ncbi:MAG: four helix bundle protein [Candidatus Omnitrophica bacterium]|nr:four helix bundle protein [Candidatus Omnitrophota bacterium]
MTLALFEDFGQFKTWLAARQWVAEIYRVTGQKPFFQDAAFRNQLRDLCSQMLAKVVEGAQQADPKDTAQFFLKAKDLLMEIRTKLYSATDLKYVTEMTFNQMFASATEVGHLFDDTIQYVRRSTENKDQDSPR